MEAIGSDRKLRRSDAGAGWRACRSADGRVCLGETRCGDAVTNVGGRVMRVTICEEEGRNHLGRGPGEGVDKYGNTRIEW